MKKILPFLNNSSDIIIEGFSDKDTFRFDDEMIVSRNGGRSSPVGSAPKPVLVPGGSN